MKTTRFLFSGLAVASLLIGLSSNAMAEARTDVWPVMKEAFFDQREIQEAAFIKIEAPRRAESGAQVPVTYTIDNAAANGVKIVKLYAFVDANPIPLAATYHLTDMLGEFHLSTRIRFEMDGFIRLVGETADGKLYLASREVRAAGGCGGAIENDEAAVRASAGKIRMNVETPTTFSAATSATFNIKHPMRTGLQRDLVSQGYAPAFYIKKTEFTYNSKPLMKVDVGVGTAEDPYFKFNFVPKEPGKLEVLAVDNEGKSFTYAVDVKG